MDFGAISSNVDEVFSINRSADVFVFGDYNIHLKVWLTYSGKTDRLVDSYNFSISNDLSQMVNFPNRILNYDSHSPVLLDLFISSDTSVCPTTASPIGKF